MMLADLETAARLLGAKNDRIAGLEAQVTRAEDLLEGAIAEIRKLISRVAAAETEVGRLRAHIVREEDLSIETAAEVARLRAAWADKAIEWCPRCGSPDRRWRPPDRWWRPGSESEVQICSHPWHDSAALAEEA